MNISLDWLSDYVEMSCSADEISEILSDLGFPLEGMEKVDGDTVLDVEVTSNRGDCLSHIGIAREFAAATGKELKLPEARLEESEKDVSEFCSVEIDDADLCKRYTARIIEGVKVGASPEWMKKRLEAIGVRSVNNVVDATNYAMMETGQPSHAFDFEKLSDGKIIVRKAKAGEGIVSIDETKCELNSQMLVIADAAKPVAIAGVMGGLETEVSEATTTVLLEDAWFEPVCVRTTSRKLALPSESSFRFERNVDVEKIEWASKRTAQLIMMVAGGKLVKGVVDIYPGKWEAKKVSMRVSRLNKLLGIEIEAQVALDILSKLQFEPELSGDEIVCSVPSWRNDIYREVDLIEEVARVHGYDKVPTESRISIEVTPVDKRQKFTETAAGFLNGCGFYETISVSFIDNATAGIFGAADEYMSVKDESRKSANMLRQSLFSSLLTVLRTNYRAKNVDCRVYEIANTFEPAAKSKDGLPAEKTRLALVSDGSLQELRGVIEGLVKLFSPDSEVYFSRADFKWATAGAKVVVDGKVIGQAGIFNRQVCDKFDLKEAQPSGVEVELEALMELQDVERKLKPIPRFPSIERDLSIVVDEKICWADIEDVVKKNACKELEDVKYVGVYRGKVIEAGSKSVTLSLCFRDEDGTLRHEVVDEFEAKIVKSLGKKVGAQLRTV